MNNANGILTALRCIHNHPSLLSKRLSSSYIPSISRAATAYISRWRDFPHDAALDLGGADASQKPPCTPSHLHAFPSRHPQTSGLTLPRGSSNRSARNAAPTARWLALSAEEKASVATGDVLSLLNNFAERGLLPETEKLVEYLVRERKCAPTAGMYRALIVANAAPGGSVEGVMHWMKDMEKEGIGLDEDICGAIFKVLAVHPDYLLLQGVLAHMEGRWLTVNEKGEQFIAASWLRGGQVEKGVEAIEKMQNTGKDVPVWLYDLAIYSLFHAGDIDEAIRMIHARTWNTGFADMSSIWYHLLEKSAEDGHYRAIALAWSRGIDSKAVYPSTGTCLQVLNAAAAHGDTDLALKVHHLFSQRRTLLKHEHYEPLIELYSRHERVREAVQVLQSMQKAGLRPTSASTRPLLQHLTKPPHDIKRLVYMWKLLEEDPQLNAHPIPMPAVNVIIEASLFLCPLPANGGLPLQFYERAVKKFKRSMDAETMLPLLEAMALQRDVRIAFVESVFRGFERCGLAPCAKAWHDMAVAYLVREQYDRAIAFVCGGIGEGAEMSLAACIGVYPEMAGEEFEAQRTCVLDHLRRSDWGEVAEELATSGDVSEGTRERAKKQLRKLSVEQGGSGGIV